MVCHLTLGPMSNILSFQWQSSSDLLALLNLKFVFINTLCFKTQSLRGWSDPFSSVKISLSHSHEVHRLEMEILTLKLTEYHVVTDWPDCGVSTESLLTGIGDFQRVAAARGSL